MEPLRRTTPVSRLGAMGNVLSAGGPAPEPVDMLVAPTLCAAVERRSLPVMTVDLAGEARPWRGCLKRPTTGAAAPAPAALPPPAGGRKKAGKKGGDAPVPRGPKPAHICWGDVQLREYERAVCGSGGVPESSSNDAILYILSLSDTIVVHRQQDGYVDVTRPASEWPADVPTNPALLDDDSDDEAALKVGQSTDSHGKGHGKAHGSTPHLGGKKGGKHRTPKLGGSSPSPLLASAHGAHDMPAFELGSSAHAHAPSTQPVFRRRTSTVGTVTLGSVDAVHAIRDPIVAEERNRRFAVGKKGKGKGGQKEMHSGSKYHTAERLDAKERQAIMIRDLELPEAGATGEILRKMLVQCGHITLLQDFRQHANCACKKAKDPLEQMNRAELEAKAQEMGMDASGNKEAIKARLRKAAQDKAEADEAAGIPRTPTGLCHGRPGTQLRMVADEARDGSAPSTTGGQWAEVPSMMDDVQARARAWRLAAEVRAEHYAAFFGEDPDEPGSTVPPAPVDPSACECAVNGVGCCRLEGGCKCGALHSPGCCNEDLLDATCSNFDGNAVGIFRTALLSRAKKLVSEHFDVDTSGVAQGGRAVPSEHVFTEPEGCRGNLLFFTAADMRRVCESTITRVLSDSSMRAEGRARKQSEGKGAGAAEGAGGAAEGHADVEEDALVARALAAIEAQGSDGFVTQEDEDEQLARAILAEEEAAVEAVKVAAAKDAEAVAAAAAAVASDAAIAVAMMAEEAVGMAAGAVARATRGGRGSPTKQPAGPVPLAVPTRQPGAAVPPSLLTQLPGPAVPSALPTQLPAAAGRLLAPNNLFMSTTADAEPSSATKPTGSPEVPAARSTPSATKAAAASPASSYRKAIVKAMLERVQKRGYQLPSSDKTFQDAVVDALPGKLTFQQAGDFVDSLYSGKTAKSVPQHVWIEFARTYRPLEEPPSAASLPKPHF